MEKLYRIISSRFDIPEHVIDRFRADPANNDAAARTHFDNVVAAPGNSWDDLALERVDVEEVKSFITNVERK